MADAVQLSAAEWKLMHCLWARSPRSAREVHDELADQTAWAYTTVKTQLDRLVAKGLVRSRMRGNVALYAPAVARERARTGALDNLLERAFDGTVGTLIEHMVDQERLSSADLGELRALIERLDKKRGAP